MKTHDLKKLAAILSESGQYRVTEKYQKQEFYNTDGASNKLIGVFLDIEATGLSYSNDKLIELGMVKFEYTEDGRIFQAVR